MAAVGLLPGPGDPDARPRSACPTRSAAARGSCADAGRRAPARTGRAGRLLRAGGRAGAASTASRRRAWALTPGRRAAAHRHARLDRQPRAAVLRRRGLAVVGRAGVERAHRASRRSRRSPGSRRSSTWPATRELLAVFTEAMAEGTRRPRPASSPRCDLGGVDARWSTSAAATAPCSPRSSAAHPRPAGRSCSTPRRRGRRGGGRRRGRAPRSSPATSSTPCPRRTRTCVKSVIHDWDDERSVAILTRVREAMPAHGGCSWWSRCWPRTTPECSPPSG